MAVLEIHALVQAVVVTDDRLGAAKAMARRTGMAVPDILATPFVCLGRTKRWRPISWPAGNAGGRTTSPVRDLDAFAPVMRLVRAADQRS